MIKPSQNERVYPWVVVGLLWFVAMLNYMDRQMLATMRPSMQVDIQTLQSATNFGRLMAIFLWIYGLMSPVSGLVADRFNRKWLIVGSLAVWSGVTFSMGYASTFNQLYALRAVMGVSEALYIPAGLALIADYHTSRTRSLAVGIHMTGLYMGQALGGFGATVAGTYSWQLAFQVFGLAGLVYAVVLGIFLRDTNRGFRASVSGAASLTLSHTPWQSLSILLKKPSFWVILLVYAIPSLPGWATKNWLPTLFATNLGIDMTTAGPLSTISIAVSSLLGVIFGGILSDQWVQTNVRGRIYTSAIGLSLTIPALLLLGYGSSLIHVLGAALCFGVGYGMFDANNMPILCQFVPSERRATAYGLMNMMGVFAGALVTDWLGKSTDAGSLGSGFAGLALIVLGALVMQLVGLKPKAIEYVPADEPEQSQLIRS
ncbi:MFS transporter [Spirosoma knui]